MKDQTTLIGSFKTDWIKYSDYELKEDEKGEVYVVPVEGSEFTLYNPFDSANDLLFDLLELGDEVLKKEQDTEIIKAKVLSFARAYGLLGFVAASVYNRHIADEEKVLLTQENLITKEKIMDTQDYLKLFLPFAEEDEVYIRTMGKELVIFKAEDSPKFYRKRPLIWDIIFSKFYCEKLDWIIEFAKNISTHFNQILIYRNMHLTDYVTIMAGKFKAEKIGLTITMQDEATIAWEFDSLKTTVETLYAFAVTDENYILKRCAYCNKVYKAKNDREKYCSASCRNCTNVIKSRNKKKLLEASE